MRTVWRISIDHRAQKQLLKLPRDVKDIFDDLVVDLSNERPLPFGWRIKHVLGEDGLYTARLKREYRAIFRVVTPDLIILSVTHRKDTY